MASWPEIRAGIFHGESGGDYDALFKYSQRPGGQFAGTKLTGMTVDEAIRFADPRGPYARWVAANNSGTVATPMGAYQIVGDTLKDAKGWAGLRGDEIMDVATQDRLAQAILANQGTGAWKGYRGPRTPAPMRHVGGAGSSPGYFAPAEDPALAPATETAPVEETPLADIFGDRQRPFDSGIGAIESNLGAGRASPSVYGSQQAENELSPLAEQFASALPEETRFDPSQFPMLGSPGQLDLGQGLAEIFKIKPIGQANIDPATGMPATPRRMYG